MNNIIKDLGDLRSRFELVSTRPDHAESNESMFGEAALDVMADEPCRLWLSSMCRAGKLRLGHDSVGRIYMMPPPSSASPSYEVLGIARFGEYESIEAVVESTGVGRLPGFVVDKISDCFSALEGEDDTPAYLYLTATRAMLGIFGVQRVCWDMMRQASVICSDKDPGPRPGDVLEASGQVKGSSSSGAFTHEGRFYHHVTYLDAHLSQSARSVGGSGWLGEKHTERSGTGSVRPSVTDSFRSALTFMAWDTPVRRDFVSLCSAHHNIAEDMAELVIKSLFMNVIRDRVRALNANFIWMMASSMGFAMMQMPRLGVELDSYMIDGHWGGVDAVSTLRGIGRLDREGMLIDAPPTFNLLSMSGLASGAHESVMAAVEHIMLQSRHLHLFRWLLGGLGYQYNIEMTIEDLKPEAWGFSGIPDTEDKGATDALLNFMRQTNPQPRSNTIFAI